MDNLRNFFDNFYDSIKPIVFEKTKENPEIAHALFSNLCWILHNTGLEKLVLDNKDNSKQLPFNLSNAAGFNKNGEIHPCVLRYLGFDRVVIGTVTNDSWNGNPKPRIIRYPETESLVNWMGLPGIGASKVAEKIREYGCHKVPITINLMSTPGKKGKELLQDLKGTLLEVRDLPSVDRVELNISCPNTPSSCGNLDARSEYTSQLSEMLELTSRLILPRQEFYVKVSPDLKEDEIDEILGICGKYPINGFTIANTTTNHNQKHIPLSPEKGGASGNAVYDYSLKVQKLFSERVPSHIKLVACGGINSIGKVRERTSVGNVTEIQILTPLVFSGTKLLRTIRREY